VDWTTIKEELYNNSAGKLLDTAKPLAPRQTDDQGQKGGRRRNRITSWSGPTIIAARTCLPRRWATTTRQWPIRDIWTWSHRGLLWSCGKLDAKYLKRRRAVIAGGDEHGHETQGCRAR